MAATGNEVLYVSSGGGFSPVTAQDVADLSSGASLSVPGAAVADITPAADGTTAGTALNALLASLRAAGVIAAS